MTAHPMSVRKKHCLVLNEYNSFDIKDNELVRDMYSRLSLIINDLNSIGINNLGDADIVRKIISLLPQQRYGSIITILHNMEDLSTLTPTIVIGKIAVVGTLNQGYPLLQYEDAVHVRRLEVTRRTAPDPTTWGRAKGTTWQGKTIHPRMHHWVRTSTEGHRTPVRTSPELPRRHAGSLGWASGPSEQGPGLSKVLGQGGPRHE
jgi:hypothetical protein